MQKNENIKIVHHIGNKSGFYVDVIGQGVLHPDGICRPSVCICHPNCGGGRCGWPGLYATEEQALSVKSRYLSPKPAKRVIEIEL